MWDFDAAYECVLFDAPVNGVPRKLLLNVNKGGYAFVVDRTNGEFISAWPVAENINWIKGVDAKGNLIGRNEPPVGKTFLPVPASAVAASGITARTRRARGWFYTTGIEWCQDVTVTPEEPKEGLNFFGGVFQLRPPMHGPAGGHLDAYDPVTGKKFWSYPSKYPLLASQLSTAGDLVFTGDPEGNFFALDAMTGKKLWSFPTGSGHRGSADHVFGERKTVRGDAVGLGIGARRVCCRNSGLKPKIFRRARRCLFSRFRRRSDDRARAAVALLAQSVQQRR